MKRFLSPFQEMVLELGCRKTLPAVCLNDKGHFLFRVFQERLKTIGNGSAVGERLQREQEVLLQKRSVQTGFQNERNFSDLKLLSETQLHCAQWQ